MNTSEIEIKIILKDKEPLLATANLSIPTVNFGYLTIKGFQIWKSEVLNTRIQDHINISPPAIRVYGRYLKIVFLEDEKCWFDLEAKIYNKFFELKREMKEDFNIDEIEKGIDELNNK